MFVKVLAVIGFVAVASAADLSVGHGGGKLIFEQNVTASPAIWKQVKNLTVNATNTTDEVISRVVVIDNRPEKDGEATVIEGGEGHKNVTLELKSPAVFRGMDFYVQVFATENVNARLPNHPKATGEDTQNPQVPKDLNVNENQEPKNGDDIILGAPKPTASSTTEASKDDQQKINPALVGNEQTRLNRDTQEQKPKDLTPVPTPVEVDATKDIKINENANKTVEAEIDENLKKALDTIFENNSTQNNEDTQKVLPVMPQAESDDLAILRDEEENRKVRQATNEPAVPALPKELTKDDHTTPKIVVSSTTEKHVGHEKTLTILRDEEENRKVRQVTNEPAVPALPKELTKDDHTTPKIVVSSTTEKHVGHEKTLTILRDEEENRKVRQATKEPVVPGLPKELTKDDHTTSKTVVSSTTEKHLGQERTVPRFVPLASGSNEDSSTTSSDQLRTTMPENVKTTQELERNIKGHHFGHHHAVPLPYVN